MVMIKVIIFFCTVCVKNNILNATIDEFATRELMLTHLGETQNHWFHVARKS